MKGKFVSQLISNSRIVAFCLLGLMLIPGFAKEEKASRDALRLEIPVLPEAGRHIELLQYPSYLAVALENNGFNPSNSSRTIIQDGQTLQFRSAVVHFVERKGTVFIYEASVDWGLGITQTSLKLPIEVDTGLVEKGKIVVRVYPPLAKFFPEELTDRIRLKIQSLADISIQKKMLDYFDGLARKRGPGRGIDGTIELVMIHAYNNTVGGAGGNVPREPGDAEPLSDQLLLLVTLAIWLVIVPLVILSRHLWRKYRHRPA